MNELAGSSPELVVLGRHGRPGEEVGAGVVALEFAGPVVPAVAHVRDLPVELDVRQRRAGVVGGPGDGEGHGRLSPGVHVVVVVVIVVAGVVTA